MIGVNGKKGGILYYSPTANQYVKIGKAWRANAADGYDVVYTSGYLNYVTGSLPLELKYSKGKPLVNWSITGNTVQDGTPTPVGEKTENLLDFKSWINDLFSFTSPAVHGTATHDDNTITLYATQLDCYTVHGVNTNRYRIFVKPSTTYAMSWDITDTSILGSVYVFFNGSTEAGHFTYTNKNLKSMTFTTLDDTEFITFRVGVRNAGDSETYSNLMINEGSTPLPYEPYGYREKSGPCEVKMVGDRTENLLDESTMTWGFYKDASFTLSAESAHVCLSFRLFLKTGTYTISGDDVTFVRVIKDGEYISNAARNEYTFTIEKDSEFGISFRDKASTTTEWTDRPIMFNEGSTPLPYEPYGYRVPVVTKRNYFDVTKSTKGMWLHSDGHTGKSNFSDISDYIDVTGLTQLMISMNIINEPMATEDRAYVLYGEDFSRITGGVYKPIGEVYCNVDIPNEAKYIRFGYDKNSENIVVSERSSIITTNLYISTPLASDEVLRSDGSRDVKWGKYEFTGEENISKDKPIENTTRFYTNRAVLVGCSIPEFTSMKCSHFIIVPRDVTDSTATISAAGANNGQMIFRINNDVAITSDNFKSWLASEYEAGTPVTVYYPLATPTTEQVTIPEIPTIKSTTILDVDTDVKPESMTATYVASKKDTAMTQYLELLNDI